ncbi:hypothetical protein SAMN05216215_101335 [Saccharopolyspora shandongensis]|uniref:Uncharacterized protein n=1 Tax=Saccharopolyspora shandongensis TaxID=418495 RepID=A0A1H3DB04_9PSEU|nr:hypothetical protein [Saccharopolyspora shandongensis]SDX63537.1 hypothetical protein SAMN05216215_101335 [Saccharopolyspora shandongensis]
MTWFPRLLGIGTAAAGAVVVLRPEALASACGMGDSDGNVAPTTAVLCRGIGVRDVLSGLAMTFAPSPDTLRLAVVARATADFGDAAVLLPGDSQARSIAATLAAGRGVLCALSGLTIRSDAADEEVVKSADDQQTYVWRRGHREGRATDRMSPLRRWVSEIVEEELRDADLVD